MVQNYKPTIIRLALGLTVVNLGITLIKIGLFQSRSFENQLCYN